MVLVLEKRLGEIWGELIELGHRRSILGEDRFIESEMALVEELGHIEAILDIRKMIK